jgi:predicted dehydrogenase
VGFGGYARVYRELLAEFEGAGMCKLAAAVVPPAQFEEATELYRGSGTRLYSGMGELFNRHSPNRLAAVLLPVPIDLHAPYAVEALERGYHVLLEKPVAGSERDALKIRTAARRSGGRVGVGFQYLYEESIRRLKRLALTERYGKLREIRVKVLWARGEHYYRRSYWAGKLAVEGRAVRDAPLNNAAAHFLQNALFLSGERWAEAAWPEEVYAENYRAYPIEGPDTQFLRIGTQSGVTITAAASHACPREEAPAMSLFFDEAVAHWRGGRVRILSRSAREELCEAFADGTGDARRAMMKDFLFSVVEQREPFSSIENAVAHAAAVTRALSSRYPIRPVQPGWLERRQGVAGPGYTGGKPGPATVIRDIELRVEEAYRRGRSFEEQGVAWSAEGGL